MILKKFFLLLSFLLFLYPPLLQAENILLATGEWTPFTSEKMVHYGKFTERVSTVFEKMQVDPEYRFYPWPRCYDSVIKGRVWAAFPYSYTEERAQKVMFSDALSCSKTVFFSYENDESEKKFYFNRIEDLKPFKIGGVSGYFYEHLFQKAGLDVDYSNKEINSLEKLRLGRIDLMPVNELVGWHLIRTYFPDDADRFKALEKPLSVNTLHLIVSKDYPHSKEFLVRFNESLKHCIENGLIQIPTCFK